MKLHIPIFLISFLSQTFAEFFYSIEKLHALFKIESENIKLVEHLVDDLYEMIDFLDESYANFASEHKKAQENVEKYVSNPLNAFLLLKRNAIDFKNIQKKIESFSVKLDEMLGKLDETVKVKHNEVTDVVGSILRLQHFYTWKSEDLAQGIIEGEQTRDPLTLEEIYVIGNASLHHGVYDFFTKNYFDIIKARIDNGESDFDENLKQEIEENLERLSGIEIMSPFNDYFDPADVGTDGTDFEIMKKACKGNVIRSSLVTKDLHCKFVSNSHFSSIAPFKLEELSFEPYIVMYHEVISDDDADTLIKYAGPFIQPAYIGMYEDATIDIEGRLAEATWLYDHEIANKLSTRYEDMTGLNTKHSEGLQVQNYGVGGLYYAHYDINNQEYPDPDDRMASMMLYVRKQ
jgi:prolyl 4-hydroxylase